ncbi:MAG TPA: DUF1636 domain-containing protein [Xanthobacteraceae bacterium]|nr:DUF1636 domain-containing protein [Xanthobacteraceae bacterium]
MFERPTSELSDDGVALDERSEAEAQTCVLVCISCRRPEDGEAYPRPGAAFAEAVRQAGEAAGVAVAVQRVRCLGNCKRGLSALVRRADSATQSWTYVFGDLDPAHDAAALIEGARLFDGSEDGFMPWRGRPSCLKRGVVARIPPLAFPGDAE